MTSGTSSRQWLGATLLAAARPQSAISSEGSVAESPSDSKVSREFWKRFESLPEHIQTRAREAYALWQEDRRHPGLYFKQVSQRQPICPLSWVSITGRLRSGKTPVW